MALLPPQFTAPGNLPQARILHQASKADDPSRVPAAFLLDWAPQLTFNTRIANTQAAPNQRNPFSLSLFAAPRFGGATVTVPVTGLSAQLALSTNRGERPDRAFSLLPPQTAPPLANPRAPSATRQFIADIWTDQKAIWRAPVMVSRRQFFAIVLPLAAASAGFIAIDDEISDAFSDDSPQRDNARIIGYFGDVYTLGLVSVGAMAGGKLIKKPAYTRAGRNALEALVAANIVGYGLKAAAGRHRPFEGDGSGDFFSGGQSFPSGHAMNSWAVAVAIGRTRGCPRWFAMLSYTMATIVSLSRLPARKHFPSDVLVGSVVGGLIGNYVATRRR